MMLAMEILDPVGSTTVASRPLAPRPASLQNAVIGVLDNSKPNARVLLQGVAHALVEQRSVGQMGDRVVEGLVGELLLERLAL